MTEYDFQGIESKWQKIWKEKDYGKSEDFADKPKHFHLVEFPYPSGAGLHVGHCMGYGASDAYCRMKRMQGYNVMFPIGWDAFGLPTENYAIKNKIAPQKATADNIESFTKQLNALGFGFDWNREINTTDPDYYHWTQWIFLQFYRHAVVGGKLVEVSDDDKVTSRLAYQAEMPVNWCPSCKINLANEEVVNGHCERCGTQTKKRNQKQWMLRITAYADRLIDDLESVDYLDRIKTQQVNWIGRSEGANIRFRVGALSGMVADEEINVFTTRADTLFGCTYVVLAPEHSLIETLGHHIQNFDEVKKYISDSAKKSDLERTELQKEKTGVKLFGVYAINPINGEKIDIWVADYVLANYGTGAVMAVPAHDERDFEFANKHNIQIKNVIIPHLIDKTNPPQKGKKVVPRRMVHGVIHDPKTDKYLCLKWKKFPWNTFVVGGIEDGEDIVDAAKREILEETGYHDLEFVRIIGGPVKTEYYAAHKDENRIAEAHAILFELKSDDRKVVESEEKAKHEPFWADKKFLTQENMVCSEIDLWVAGIDQTQSAFVEYGVLINSAEFDGLESEEAKKKIVEKLQKNGDGEFTKNFKLRDWIFSRQHYWGEPIPIIHCEKCGILPLPEDQLPLELPVVENYEPSDTGESPLAKISDWVNISCPKCEGCATRETDTMPNWAGSSWYYLAYTIAKSLKLKVRSGNIFQTHEKELKYWTPVDLYNGGMEHTTLHLLYSRFWHKFLYDLGAVPTKEPYSKRIAHGIILGPDGRKMSKSFGNVINPDEIVKQFGADTLRAYIMFIGPYDQESAWSTAGVQGVHRFLKRVWRNQELALERCGDSKELLIKLNQTIAGVTDDMENFRMNTVVSKLMEMNNLIEKVGKISWNSYHKFLTLLSPVAPHLAAELYETVFPVGKESDVSCSEWPKVDTRYLSADEIEIVVQINGKVRDKLTVPADISDEELKKIALDSPKAKEMLSGKNVLKTIIVPKKLVSIVVD